ncbi:hypothetical protein [Halioglobus sp. HI00S01]|uniref:hypothetical protein n=1 Tax=Halioglobus sp. HI00S01 TaxID=1822214 RepID=UPI0012E88A79|nr:hypothetical protein [Halioglobus sp. HI00S01]
MQTDPLSSVASDLQPEITTQLNQAIALGEAGVDPFILDLCRGYIDAALHCRDWRPPADAWGEKEQAVIQLTEQFVMSVSTLEAASIEALQSFFSADEVYALVHALYLMDMSLRFYMVGREVLL